MDGLFSPVGPNSLGNQLYILSRNQSTSYFKGKENEFFRDMAL